MEMELPVTGRPVREGDQIASFGPEPGKEQACGDVSHVLLRALATSSPVTFSFPMSPCSR